MKVAFLHARQTPVYADMMVRSVQRTMPGVELLHLADADTPAVDGCTVIRRDWAHDNPMIFKMEHLAALAGDVLVLDTDVLVRVDLRAVFGLPFDMAFTWRDGPIRDGNGADIAQIMPINCGVMFQRAPQFWVRCLQWCVGQDPGWYADQMAVSRFWREFAVLRLHCDQFNYKPKRAGEDVSGRYALHFKGGARELMRGFA